MNWLHHHHLERILVVSIAAFFLIAALLLNLFTVSDYVDDVSGKIVSKEPPIRMLAEVQSHIKRVLVGQGQAVKKGDVLIEFDVEAALAELQQIRADIRQQEISRAALARRQEIIREKIDVNNSIIRDKRQLKAINNDKAEIDVTVAEKSVVAMEQIQALSERMLNNASQHINDPRFSTLDKLSILTDANENLREMNELAVKAKSVRLQYLEGATRYGIEIGLLQKENLELESQWRQAVEAISEAENEQDKLESRLRTAEQKAQRLIVRAPMDGVVIAISDAVKRANIVKANDELLVIHSGSSELEAELNMNDEQFKDARIGQTVNLELYAWNHYRYGVVRGRIIQLSQDKIVSNNFDRPGYIAKVAIHDRSGVELKMGYALKSRLIIGEISLYEYILKKLSLS